MSQTAGTAVVMDERRRSLLGEALTQLFDFVAGTGQSARIGVFGDSANKFKWIGLSQGDGGEFSGITNDWFDGECPSDPSFYCKDRDPYTGAGDAVKEIRERAKHTANVAKMTEPPKAEHNSEGKGGGGLGRCPVVVEGDTTVETKDVDNGVEITVKAKKDVVALQKETKLRAANFTGK